MSMHSDPRDGGAGWLIGAVKNNPEGLLLLAAGCALLMRSTNQSPRRDLGSREYGRSDLSQAARVRRDRSVGERLSETVQKAGDYVSDVSESVAETASNYASSASNYADDVARRAAEQTGHLAQAAQSTMQNTIKRVVQEQPLAVALAGIAAGAVVAAAFPVSEIENRTLGTTGKQLREAAGKAGEQLKDAASKAGQRLAAAADKRGLNTEGLKDVARDVGEAFSDTLENEDTSQTARSGGRTSSITTARSTSNTTQRAQSKKRRPKLNDADIRRIEREVEAARAKLVTDLSRLRSPRTYNDFAETAKNVLVGKVKTSTQSAWQGLVENMKAKAAENPAATLAISAGLAWRLLRHPPIATALIGAGLFSLLRTPSAHIIARESGDYVSHATERLKQQATDLAGGVADSVSDLASELKNDAGTITEAIKEQSAQLAGAATDKVQEWAAGVGEAVHDVPDHAASLARTAERSTQHLRDPEVRDTILLGIAGAAVVAALGVAYQRRTEDFEIR